MKMLEELSSTGHGNGGLERLSPVPLVDYAKDHIVVWMVKMWAPVGTCNAVLLLDRTDE